MGRKRSDVDPQRLNRKKTSFALVAEEHCRLLGPCQISVLYDKKIHMQMGPTCSTSLLSVVDENAHQTNSRPFLASGVVAGVVAVVSWF